MAVVAAVVVALFKLGVRMDEQLLVSSLERGALTVKFKLTAVGVGAGFELWWALMLQRQCGGGNNDRGQWRTMWGC